MSLSHEVNFNHSPSMFIPFASIKDSSESNIKKEKFKPSTTVVSVKKHSSLSKRKKFSLINVRLYEKNKHKSMSLLEVKKAVETQTKQDRISSLQIIISYYSNDKFRDFFIRHFYPDVNERTMRYYLYGLSSILQGGNPYYKPSNKFIRSLTAYGDIAVKHFRNY